jgi:hypothetical protein
MTETFINLFRALEHSDFGHCFGFRISCFGFYTLTSQRADHTSFDFCEELLGHDTRHLKNANQVSGPRLLNSPGMLEYKKTGVLEPWSAGKSKIYTTSNSTLFANTHYSRSLRLASETTKSQMFT